MTESRPSTMTGDAPVSALIFVIEDEDSIRRLVQDTLEGEGYRVVTARSAEDGLALLEGAITPALILLDLRLPGMDGFGFIEAYRARTDGATNAAPIVLVSALRPRDELPEGVVGYLRKPFDLDDLLARVERTITA